MPAPAFTVPGIIRPRLSDDVPLVFRPPDRLQVGEEADAPVLGHVPAAVVEWLSRIDGTRTWEQLAGEVAASPCLDRVMFERIVRLLARRGALRDAGAIPDHWRWADADYRYAHLGELAATRLALRDEAAAVRALEARSRVRIEIVGENALADALSGVVEHSGMQRTTTQPTVRIIASTLHHDVLDPAWIDHEVPHALATCHGARGIAGPFVLPGQTSCLRCRNLHRIDHDPRWAQTSVELATRAQTCLAPPVDRTLAMLVAARTVLLVRAWADAPELTHAWADLAIELTLPDAQMRDLRRPPHPLCGCRWSMTATSDEGHGADEA